MDLNAIAAGAALKKVEVKDGKAEALAKAGLMSSINKQGVIAMPEDREGKVEAMQKAAVAQATTLRSINKQGVISMPSDHAPKASNEHLARGMMLNSINRQGVISVPEGHAPDKALTAEQIVDLQKAAKLEKEEMAQAKLPVKESCDAKEGEYDEKDGFANKVIREDRHTAVEIWKAGSREGPHRHKGRDLTILISGKMTITSLEQDEAGAWKKVTSVTVLENPGESAAIPAGTVHSVDYNAATTLIYQQDGVMADGDPEWLDPADGLKCP